MKISFIICYSSTWPMTVFDKEAHPEADKELDKKILKQTNRLIKQILGFTGLNKEVILIDNSGDFVTDIDSDHLFVLKGAEVSEKTNQAKITADAYDIGIKRAKGTHLVIQHNDTQYLTDYYSPDELFVDLVRTLDDFRLEYITVDAKPAKVADQDENFYADCYWFLCKSDFYTKHDIKVGHLKGDNNHDATITCLKKGLKFLHLPGYYELSGLAMNHTINLRRTYPGLTKLDGNIHTFLNIPFLYHYKGGTGLGNLIHKHDIIY